MRFTVLTKCAIRFSFAWLATLNVSPAHAITLLEGRIHPGVQAGAYDLLLEVWSQSDTGGAPNLQQIIQIPKVEVVKGNFKIPLDESLETKPGARFSFKVQARRFEAWEPFRQAEVVRVSKLTPTAPGLVLR